MVGVGGIVGESGLTSNARCFPAVAPLAVLPFADALLPSPCAAPPVTLSLRPAVANHATGAAGTQDAGAIAAGELTPTPLGVAVWHFITFFLSALPLAGDARSDGDPMSKGGKRVADVI
jgi:hypothetical protein